MIAATALAGALSLAIVSQDRVALRNGPRDSAAQQAVLWQGDSLEVRGERMGYVQVWDHRRERAGWVAAGALRVTALRPEDAPELLSVLRFLRDAPGAESQGIAYVAAYLKAAPAGSIGAEPFDALGVMAERLARRAAAKQGSETASAQLEVAAQYGVVFKSYEQNGLLQLCYDGEAFRRVLLRPTDLHMRARAVLALTRTDCLDPAMPPLERQQLDRWRAELLDGIAPAEMPLLSAFERNAVQMQRAGVWAALAFQAARRGDDAQPAGRRALDALAAVDKAELGDADAVVYNDAAIRVGASRWSIVPVAASTSARLRVVTQAGEPGQTCVLLLDQGHGRDAPLARRCTWGVAWAASAVAASDGRTLTLAVQPLEAWRELWVFRRGAEGWAVEVLPPAESAPGLGYVEFAGWVPRADKLLLAREVRDDGRMRHTFDVVAIDTLAVERQVGAPSDLPLFVKWQDAAWKTGTVSLR